MTWTLRSKRVEAHGVGPTPGGFNDAKHGFEFPPE